MRRRVILSLAMLAGLHGCDEPTFDASSDAAMRASINRMTARLSPDDQKRFLRGAVGTMMRESARARRAKSPVSAAESAKSLHGLTAREVMAKGDDLGAAK